MTWFLTGLAALGLAVLAGSHLGSFWPPGDSLSVLCPQILALSIPVLALLVHLKARKRAGSVVLAVLASAAVTGFLWAGGLPFRGAVQDGAPDLVLYQKNLLWNNADPTALEQDIRALGPDLLTFQEVSSENLSVLSALADLYPHQQVCLARQGNGGTAILSRHALRPLPCMGSGLSLAETDIPGIGPLTLGAVHLRWPWPYDQAGHVQRLTERLATIEGPVILAGDFNLPPWGGAVALMAKSSRTRALSGLFSTYPGFGPAVPLPIDHILVPAGWTGKVEPRPLLGSDHLGVLAWLYGPSEDQPSP